MELNILLGRMYRVSASKTAPTGPMGRASRRLFPLIAAVSRISLVYIVGRVSFFCHGRYWGIFPAGTLYTSVYRNRVFRGNNVWVKTSDGANGDVENPTGVSTVSTFSLDYKLIRV